MAQLKKTNEEKEKASLIVNEENELIKVKFFKYLC
jgi:hypothetical protein